MPAPPKGPTPPPPKKKKPAPPPPKKKKKKPSVGELLDEMQHGDAPLEEAPEDPGVPQAFLDAAPKIPEEAELEEVGF